MEITLYELMEFSKLHPEVLSSIKVKGRYGWFSILAIDITAKDSEVIQLSLEDGRTVRASPDHLFWETGLGWAKTRSLQIGQYLDTEDGPSKIVSKELLNNRMDLYDIQVDQVKEFYANGIVSHNSSIIEAITFALYGKSYRKIKKDQLVNSINEKGCLVEIEFSVNNGTYKVRRGIKPVVFEVYHNGTLLNQDNKNRDYQKILEQQILKMSYRTFTQIVALGSAKYTPFMELPTWSRREFTEEILDLSIFSVMASVIKDSISEHKKELVDLQTNIKVVKASIRENKEFLSHIESNKDSQIKEFEKELSDAEEKIQELDGKLEEIKQEMNQSSSEEFLNNLKNEIDELASQIREYTSTISKSTKDIKFYSENDTCPTCTQVIDVDFKAHICDGLKDEVYSSKNKIEQLKQIYSDKSDEYQIVLEEINKLKSRHIEILTETQSQNALMKRIKKRIETLKTTEDVSYKEYQDKLDSLVTSYQEFETTYKKGLSKLKYFDLCLKLSSDSGIKSKIIATYIPMLNSLINKYLSMMDFYVSFYLDENFEETIKSRFRDSFSYASFSEGEKNRINLSLILGFLELTKSKNSVHTNLLFIDELFDGSLDQEGVELVSRLLKDQDMNIFIISHNDKLRDKFNRVLIAEKIGNFSQVREI